MILVIWLTEIHKICNINVLHNVVNNLKDFAKTDETLRNCSYCLDTFFGCTLYIMPT